MIKAWGWENYCPWTFSNKYPRQWIFWATMRALTFLNHATYFGLIPHCRGPAVKFSSHHNFRARPRRGAAFRPVASYQVLNPEARGGERWVGWVCGTTPKLFVFVHQFSDVWCRYTVLKINNHDPPTGAQFRWTHTPSLQWLIIVGNSFQGHPWPNFAEIWKRPILKAV